VAVRFEGRTNSQYSLEIDTTVSDYSRQEDHYGLFVKTAIKGKTTGIKRAVAAFSLNTQNFQRY
jgi:hypothetical protein